MLNLVLVLLVLVIWTAIYVLYFRGPLGRWIGNRFGRDKAPPAPGADSRALFAREETEGKKPGENA